jgi:hypothetical protein
MRRSQDCRRQNGIVSTIEIAIPVEIALDNLPTGISIVRNAANYVEFAETGRNWPTYVISGASSIALGVLSNYIYDAVKESSYPNPKAILIEHEDVRFDRGEIERVIRRKIMIQEK